MGKKTKGAHSGGGGGGREIFLLTFLAFSYKQTLTYVPSFPLCSHTGTVRDLTLQRILITNSPTHAAPSASRESTKWPRVSFEEQSFGFFLQARQSTRAQNTLKKA